MKKRKKYKSITLEQARALWMLGTDVERKWGEGRTYCSVTLTWGPYKEGMKEYDFYVTQDRLFFRVEVE